MAYQIFIIEDHPALREGYRQILERKEDLAICGESPTGSEVSQMLAWKKPDIVLLDLFIPIIGGMQLLRQLKKRYPRLPVLIVSEHNELFFAPLTLSAGASGYVEKSHVVYTLELAIRQVLEGRRYISQEVEKLIFSYDVTYEIAPQYH